MYAGSGDVIQYSNGLLLTAAIFQDATLIAMVAVSSTNTGCVDMFKSKQDEIADK
jgi:hypothetical protein